MAKRPRDSKGRFRATQIARLVSDRPDLATGIVEVQSPPFSWKRMLWKGVRPALVVAVPVVLLQLFPTPEHVQSMLGLSPVAAVLVWEAVRNYGKQNGWWGNV